MFDFDSNDRCIYCGSRNYGPSCIYSPHKNKVHVHVHNGGRCIYCGTNNLAGKCIYNPYGGNHVAGGDLSGPHTG